VCNRWSVAITQRSGRAFRSILNFTPGSDSTITRKRVRPSADIWTWCCSVSCWRALAEPPAMAYQADELLTVWASAEAAEAEGKELERRAKRYGLSVTLSATQIGRPLEATAFRRRRTSAELDAYAVRGSLTGGSQSREPVAHHGANRPRRAPCADGSDSTI